MQITRVFFPENLDLDPAANVSRPISKLSLTYAPPAGQTLLVKERLATLVNGVDASLLSGTPVDPSLIALPFPLWIGSYTVCLAQGVEHVIGADDFQFPTGAIYSAAADWRDRLPLSSQPYRKHGISFPTAIEFITNSMDRMWSEHQDAAIIAQLIGTLRQTGEALTVRMMNARSASYSQWVEALDRVDGVVITVNGAVSAPVPFSDIEALYHLPSNSRAYLFGYDFFINPDKRVVFTCNDAPGRTTNSVVVGTGMVDRPPEDTFTIGTKFQIQLDPLAMFCATEEMTGFDYFINPPRLPDDGGYPTFQDGSSFVGKILAHIPRTGETFTLHDPAVGANVFSGSVTFAAPIFFQPGDYIQIYQVRPLTFTDSSGVNHGDTNPVIDMMVWMNRSVKLLGPHAHQFTGRLNYLWTQIAGGDISSTTLHDRLRAAAALQARVEKSNQSIATYVATMLGVPVSPFEGGYVTGIFPPDPGGIVPGQISVYGAIQEFNTPLNFAVSVGDKVSFLQPLVHDSDGVTIHDAFTDSDFLAFSSNGTPPATDPTCTLYVQSKFAGAVQLPDDFMARFPGGSQTFFAAEILKSKSFRIDLGVFASQQFLLDSESTVRIFAAIDAVKPSGTDYWIRLSDGTAITRPTAQETFVDVSSNLDLPTDFAQRIYLDEQFATNQWRPFLVYPLFGSKPLAGDTYKLHLKNTPGAGTFDTTFTEVLTAADLLASPLHPLGPLLQRWADAVNTTFSISPTNLVADVVNHALRIVVFPDTANYEELLYKHPVFGEAFQTTGPGVVRFSVQAPTLLPPPDASTVWGTLAEAVDTMNSFREVPFDNGPSLAEINDFGAGPFDATTYGPTAAASTTWFSDNTASPTRPRRMGRIRVEGYAYSTGGDSDARIELGFSVLPPFTPGAVVNLTVSHAPAIPGFPISINRTVIADEVDSSTVILGLAHAINSDPVLSAKFKAIYPQDLGITPAPAYLVIIPLDSDDPDIANFSFTISAGAGWGGPPSFYIANSAGSSSGVGPLTKSPTPSTPVSVDFVLSGPPFFAARTITKSIGGPRVDGGGNRFVVEATYLPRVVSSFIASTVQLDVNRAPGGRMIAIQNMRLTVNNYPEYSRDVSAMTLDSVKKIDARAGTFTFDAAQGNPPLSPVPTPVPIPYYIKTELFIDVTPRMIAPSQQFVSAEIDDFSYTEIYLGTPAVLVYTVLQNKDPGNVPVTIQYIPITSTNGGAILYLRSAAGIFTPLVRGTDFTEAATPATTITVSAAVDAAITAGSTVVGFVRSTMYDYFFQGPNSAMHLRASYLNSAPGIRALYDEPQFIFPDGAPSTPTPPDQFRINNADNLVSGAPIAAPFDVAAYLASGVKDNPAFGMDTNTVRIIPSGIIAEGKKLS